MLCSICGSKFIDGVCPNCGMTEIEQNSSMKEYQNQTVLCSRCGQPLNAQGNCTKCTAAHSTPAQPKYISYDTTETIPNRPAVASKAAPVFHDYSSRDTVETAPNKSSMSQKTVIIICAAVMFCICLVVALFNSGNETAPPVYVPTEENTNQSYDDFTEEQTTTTPEPAFDCYVGDIITLGSYEQDGDYANGAEPLKWMIIEKDSDKALALSVYALDVKQFHTDRTQGHTWADSSLRTWLNTDFYNEAFSSSDKELILTTEIINADNPDFHTDGGRNTHDEVFLLSIDEARRLLSQSERSAAPTWYSRIQGNYANYQHDNVCWWWLRSTGDNAKKAGYVDEFGNIGPEGNWINLEISVRPAIYIDLN